MAITREEALPIARSIAAGACAMRGHADDYCAIMREGRMDDEPVVQATLAALVMSPVYIRSRLAEIAERSAKNVVELAA